MYFTGLNIVRNIWDDVSSRLNKTYNAEMLHIALYYKYKT